ncbi:hypothetical protein F5Y18DRAFT_377089, partial [Xylariaceae sp. FL1019]
MSHEHDNHNDLPYPTESTMPRGPSLDLDEIPVHHRSKETHARPEAALEDPFPLIDDFQTLILIDDTESMKDCWNDVGKILEKLGPVYTKYGHRGMNIEFLKHRARGYLLLGGQAGYYNITLADGSHAMQDNVAGIYLNVKPKGHYDMETRVERILHKWLFDAKTTYRRALNHVRPWRLLVVSKWTMEDVEKVLRVVRKISHELEELDAPHSIFGIQMLRVGTHTEEWLNWDVWNRFNRSNTFRLTGRVSRHSEPSPDRIMELILGGNWRMYLD